MPIKFVDTFASWAASVPLGRVGTMDEVAQTVLFLMDNGFMTGSIIYPDGGFVMKRWVPAKTR